MCGLDVLVHALSDSYEVPFDIHASDSVWTIQNWNCCDSALPVLPILAIRFLLVALILMGLVLNLLPSPVQNSFRSYFYM